MKPNIFNVRCVLRSGGDEPGSPAMDNFKLIDFAFIVEVPDKTSMLK
jgi:hypothetical protein